MKRLTLRFALTVGMACALWAATASEAQAHGRCSVAVGRGPHYRNSGANTAYQNGQMYAHPGWGTPVGMVVPPRAGTQVDYSWGVPSSRRTVINKTFPDLGVGGGAGYPPAPAMPTDTTQMGVYYLRVPRHYGH